MKLKTIITLNKNLITLAFIAKYILEKVKKKFILGTQFIREQNPAFFS